MNIPLDRLYSFLHDISNHAVIIYRFFPHGSKNLKDVMFSQGDFDDQQIIPGTQVSTSIHLATMPLMIAHDQEPLQYDLYTKQQLKEFAMYRMSRPVDVFSHPDYSTKTKLEITKSIIDMHLRSTVDIPGNIYDKFLLCHSEKNSHNLKLYEQNGFVGVYWWSHAMIALDWYRYAESDQRLKFDPSAIKKDFLVYNRAWTGTREYRLKFAELVVQKNLKEQCAMRFSPYDSGIDYKDYDYKNKSFQVNTALEQHFLNNDSSSNDSGDYSNKDYASCAIDVVLETLFDDSRQHLTEKTLRAIACGKPFILVSTAGALKYLQSYGFKTFNKFIDESYDAITDPVQRLNAITDLMSSISNMPQDQKQVLWGKLHEIAEYNKQRFFSNDFKNMIVDEYKDNLRSGLELLKDTKRGTYYYQYKKINVEHGSRLLKPCDMEYIESVLNSSSS